MTGQTWHQILANRAGAFTGSALIVRGAANDLLAGLLAMTGINNRGRRFATPCCHSRRPKAAFNITPKADVGQIG
jgi:hypothetical protein